MRSRVFLLVLLGVAGVLDRAIATADPEFGPHPAGSLEWTITEAGITALEVPPLPAPAGILRVANLSTTDTATVRVWTSETPDLSSMDSILEYVRNTAKSEDPSDLSLACAHLMRRFTYHAHPATDSDDCHDPVKLLNVYGYGLCDDSARVMATLWSRLGLRANLYDLGWHVVSEYYDGDVPRLLDADLQVAALGSSQRPLGLHALMDDPSKLQVYPEGSVPRDEAWLESLRGKYRDSRKKARRVSWYPVTSMTCELKLRPGEHVTRFRQSELGYFSKFKHAAPARYGNAVFELEAVATAGGLLQELAENFEELTGFDLFDEPVDLLDEVGAWQVLSSYLPYLVIDGVVELLIPREGADGEKPPLVRLTTDGAKWSEPVQQATEELQGQWRLRCALPRPARPAYQFHVAVRMGSKDTQGLSVRQRVTTQCSALSFPMLSEEQPSVLYVYTDKPGMVRIRYELESVTE